MARSSEVQSSFVSGILGQEAEDRTDVEEYYSGARDLLNVDPRPGGGFQLRPGLAYYGRLRNVLAGIDVAGATVTGGAQLSGATGTAPPPDPPPDPSPGGPGSYPDLPPWQPVGGRRNHLEENSS